MSEPRGNRSLYERRPEYWTQDLGDRAFERQVREQLDMLHWEYGDQTGALHRPDFVITLPVRGKRLRVALEVKEKRQHYRGRWAELAGTPETELLVLDELSARTLLRHAPRAFLLFWDQTHEEQPYVLFSVLDLYCAPRRRVLRPIHRNSPRFKAKWLLDRRHGHVFRHLREVFAYIATYLVRDLDKDLRRLEAYGDFEGEEVAEV